MAVGFKSGGRTKGVQNKLSLRFLDDLRKGNFDPMKEALKIYRNSDQMTDDKRIEFCMRLMSFCYPTLKSVEVSGEREAAIPITFENVADLCRIAREASLPPKDETL